MVIQPRMTSLSTVALVLPSLVRGTVTASIRFALSTAATSSGVVEVTLGRSTASSPRSVCSERERTESAVCALTASLSTTLPATSGLITKAPCSSL